VLSPEAAEILAERFALGAGAMLEGPVARGQLGQVWRLWTDVGRFAVKEWFAGADAEVAGRDAEFSELARTAGVFTPAVIRTTAGEVTAHIDGTTVRVSEWVDLRPRTRSLDPAEVGATVARLHTVGQPAPGPVDRWFSEGFGPVPWCALLEHLVDEGAPFVDDLAPLVGPLIEAESVMEQHEAPILCHRDLWADNVLPTADGRICVIDFENLGPADPSQELAMVLFEFTAHDADRARALHEAYVDAGGPARVTRPGHFTMLLAMQAHISHLAASRWVGEKDRVERLRLEGWFREMLEDPVTLPQIEAILDAIT
jgi:Ser/Thr protein kinase RdoA (MazF antagonist)